MEGAIWGGMAKCGGGGAEWLAPKDHTCCRRLWGKQINANLKQIGPTGYAIGDSGRDGSTFTSVRGIMNNEQ